jgi:hypothetical protein
MIEQAKNGSYEVSCDSCSHQDEFDAAGHWSTLLRQLRLEGWQWRDIGGGAFVHHCPSCVANGHHRPEAARPLL